MERGQFSTRDLLLAMTLIGIGLTILDRLFPYPFELGPSPPMIWLVPWFIAGASIGAGLLAPFRWKRLGAALAFAIQVAHYFLVEGWRDFGEF